MQACPANCRLSHQILSSADSDATPYLFPEVCPVPCGTGNQNSYQIVLEAAANGGVACPATQICSDEVLQYGYDFTGLTDLDASILQYCVVTNNKCNIQVR